MIIHTFCIWRCLLCIAYGIEIKRSRIRAVYTSKTISLIVTTVKTQACACIQWMVKLGIQTLISIVQQSFTHSSSAHRITHSTCWSKVCRTCGSMSNAELNQEFHWVLPQSNSGYFQLPNSGSHQIIISAIVIVTATNLKIAVTISISYAQLVCSTV